MKREGIDKSAVLKKLGITHLNQMQVKSADAIAEASEVVLLSPTGTGKTLAFLLPLFEQLDRSRVGIQMLILVPSRELAIQIEQVMRELGSGYKINAVYGGRSGSKDKVELKSIPTVLVGTPGRVADHMRRGNIDTEGIRFLVLDEFDKSLEIGFEKEMKAIMLDLWGLEKKVLTSATEKMPVPEFVGLNSPLKLDFTLDQNIALSIKVVESSEKDKLEALVRVLKFLNGGKGIVFCNFKNTIEFVSTYLKKNNIEHSCFYGGLEQIDRERALIKFRNQTVNILLATDLAARGIDVPEIDYIVHYQLPPNEEEFIHRNGRTARMHRDGTAYILTAPNEKLRAYIKDAETIEVDTSKPVPNSKWTTLYISGGRRDKISKGDIAGLFFKQGNLESDELGVIELKRECAFVAVPRSKSAALIKRLSPSKLKKKKVRISEIS